MDKVHTPRSFLLVLAGCVAILAAIFVPHLFPGPFSSLLGNGCSVAAAGLLWAGLRSMKPADQSRLAGRSRKETILRYAAAYMRLIWGLLVVLALVAFSKGWKVANPHTIDGVMFLAFIFVVSAAALTLTILGLRQKSARV